MRDEILETALKQFLKHGIREMSNNRLVELLGISTKTLYKYFTNKEDLLEQVLHLFYDQQFTLLEERAADHKIIPLFLDVWYAAFENEYEGSHTFFQDLHYYYPALDLKIRKSIADRFHKKFIYIIRQGMDEGVFQENIDPALSMESIYVFYDTASKTDRFKKLSASPYSILLNTIVIYIRGLCTPKGLKELDKHVQEFIPFETGKKKRKKTATI
jgi:AcrR family transcriptional regulator